MTNQESSKLLFISHIHDEAELAEVLQRAIEEAFKGKFKIFRSSSAASLPAGHKWVNTITENLHSCNGMIILCSKFSVTRPWINFESGAAWVRDIPAIPFCFAGMSISNLQPPLSELHAVNGDTEKGLQDLFSSLSQMLDSYPPQIDYKELLNKITDFSNRYLHDYQIIDALNILRAYYPKEYHTLLTNAGQPVVFPVEEYMKREIIPALNKLKEEQVLNFTIRNSAMTAGSLIVFYLIILNKDFLLPDGV